MAENKQPAQTNQDNRQIAVAAQYVKDISFENPGAPQSLQVNEKPDIAVTVDVKAQAIGKDTYEVELKVGANATRGNEPLFVCEVTYAGVFVINGVPEAELEGALLIFSPSLLFPYIRRIVSDLTRDGGFPALMLDPIDFVRLYQQRNTQVTGN